MTQLTHCRICQSPDLHSVLDLGSQPPANAFFKPGDPPPKAYPLGLVHCSQCHALQLSHVLPKDVNLFENYVYESCATQGIVTEMKALAAEILERKPYMVVELGCNDGVMLQNLVGRVPNVFGVEPAATVAAKAREKGVTVFEEFFTFDTARRIEGEYGHADVITGTNVLAHIEDLPEALRAMKRLLKPDGVLIFEFPYVVDFLAGHQIDTCYHEHIFYLGLRPLMVALGQVGLRITKAVRTSVHCGSIRVYASRESGDVSDLLAAETQAEKQWLGTLQKDAEAWKNHLTGYLLALSHQGRSIVGYSAPAKGNVLLSFCGLHLKYLVDVSPSKQGLLAPAPGFPPVFSPQHFLEDQPDYALVLAHNHLEEVVRREATWRAKGGRFVVSMGKARVI